jgi:hypothetical protein
VGRGKRVKEREEGVWNFECYRFALEGLITMRDEDEEDAQNFDRKGRSRPRRA